MSIPSHWSAKIKDPLACGDGRSPAQVLRGRLGGRPVYLKTIGAKYAGTTYSVIREAKVMQWLQGKLIVPQVFDWGTIDSQEYLVMSELTGRHIDDFQGSAEAYVGHLAKSVQAFQAVPIVDCPFDSGIALRLKELEYLLANNLADTDQANWEKSTHFSSPAALFDWLVGNAPTEELVFSHGDVSANIFVSGSGYCFYDLARAGVADKWLDIAFCVRDIRDIDRSGKYEKLLFQLLGVEPDYKKIDYFILLDELF